MKTIVFALVAFLPWAASRMATAQVPNLENRVALSLANQNERINSAVSDRYGHHIITSGTAKYYLLGNDGSIIHGPVTLGEAGDFQEALTSYGGRVTIVSRFSGGDQIRVYQSSNGGATWPSELTKTYSIPTEAEPLDKIDAYADGNGVHIVWDKVTTQEIYYVMFDPSSGVFDLFENVSADIPAGLTGIGPKVISLGNKVVVSFVRTDAGVSKDVGVSRNVDYSTQPPSWDTFIRATTVVSSNDDVLSQSIGWLGDDIHMIEFESASGSDNVYSSMRASGGNWTTPSDIDDFTGGDPENHRRRITSTKSNVYATFIGPSTQVRLRTFVTDWSTLDILDNSAGSSFVTLSSNNTGAYVYWSLPSSGVVYMMRKVSSLNGSISESPHWLTGNNWVSDILTIEAGVTVTAKAGCSTYVLANKKIVVKSGGTLIVEPGAKFFFETGAQLEVQGTLTVNGSSASHAVFDRRTGTTKWGGIVIQNTGAAPTATISYADIFRAGTAVRVGSNANFTMTNSKVDIADIGLQFVSSGTGTPAKTVSTSTFDHITVTGVEVNNFSQLTLSDNQLYPVYPAPPSSVGVRCDAASPKLLRNHIKWFGYGLYCTNGSSPVLENFTTGGNNIIEGSEQVSVYCEYSSNAVLGFISGAFGDIGGQNSIYGGGSYDVELKSSTVSAENNWWGSSGDPVNQFSPDPGSSIDYDPWLTEDPNRLGPVVGGNGRNTSSYTPEMGLALEKRTAGEFLESAIILRGIIANQNETLANKTWALYQLLSVSQMMQGSGLVSLLNSSITANSPLAATMKAMLPAARFNEGYNTGAIAAYDANIVNYPNSGVEKAALYGKILHALYNQNNPVMAGTMLGRLQLSYPQSVEAAIAAVQVQSFIPRSAEGSTGISREVTGEQSSENPSQFRLMQNYPNPFNPSTTITYSLPENAHITLKVFDVLGREVLSLVEGAQKSGTHSVMLDASALSSGIYFYRLTAGEFSDTKKLVLMK